MGICLIFLIFARHITEKLPISVDVIEHNIVIPQETPGVKQFIFWRWSPDYRRYHCHGYIIESNLVSISKINDTYILEYIKNGSIIRLSSKIFIKTWTKHDPERENKKIFPEEYRWLR